MYRIVRQNVNNRFNEIITACRSILVYKAWTIRQKEQVQHIYTSGTMKKWKFGRDPIWISLNGGYGPTWITELGVAQPSSEVFVLPSALPAWHYDWWNAQSMNAQWHCCAMVTERYFEIYVTAWCDNDSNTLITCCSAPVGDQDETTIFDHRGYWLANDTTTIWGKINKGQWRGRFTNPTDSLC